MKKLLFNFNNINNSFLFWCFWTNGAICSLCRDELGLGLDPTVSLDCLPAHTHTLGEGMTTMEECLGAEMSDLCSLRTKCEEPRGTLRMLITKYNDKQTHHTFIGFIWLNFTFFVSHGTTLRCGPCQQLLVWCHSHPIPLSFSRYWHTNHIGAALSSLPTPRHRCRRDPQSGVTLIHFPLPAWAPSLNSTL